MWGAGSLKGLRMPRHSPAMKSIAFALVALASLALAGQPAGRVAIQGVVEALNRAQFSGGQKGVAGLFTEDADNQLDRLRLQPGGEPWTEVTAPRLVVESIRFITADVALVDAANTQYGSLILVRRVPVLLVMRKGATGWRIASLRMLADSRAQL